jgi:hypothetical protein
MTKSIVVMCAASFPLGQIVATPGALEATTDAQRIDRPNPADSITITWHIDDVAEVRPDLTKAQCRDVLAQAKDRHDAVIGITWDVLEIHADDLFPQEAGAS